MSNPLQWKVGMSYHPNQEASLKDVKEAGLDCIELVIHGKDWHREFEHWSAYFTQLVQEAAELGLEIWSIHLPYGDDWDVSSLDSTKREQALSTLSSLLQLIDSWKVGRAILHPSYEPVPPEDRTDRLTLCQEGLHALIQRNRNVKVRLAVECLPRTCLGNTSDEILYLVEPTPELIVCCDVNHLLQETQTLFIQKTGARIGTVHMSDYDGKDERHWLPGEGIIDWDQVLDSLAGQGYDGPFLFEVRNPDPRELVQCWKRLLSSRS
ncbi:sugar phosphate isomerase/epimerase family protein [Paenibacillus senegalensis]|uniref:sugar phosphate isomerase/epimerase family protein n=1 Tax=Paenibacillus senegalensis TaxID=1465766 RepID=UPI0002883DA4|nr:sugar phosphate isomerase/epimerase family protein [Paenibacillus senegalensis]